jgi:D-amino peptidase
MKVYMLWDMEGVTGLLTREHCWWWEARARPQLAAEGRGLMMEDVKSACAAALSAGADEVVVVDDHHGGGNLILSQLPADPRITYYGGGVGCYQGQFRWMPGLDESVDCFMLPGHHAKEGSPGSFIPHTSPSRLFADFRINGVSVGEIGIESCFAGHWHIPIILVHGDRAVCQEARELFPWVVTAEVKQAVGRDQCVGLDPEAGRRLTAQRIAEAIESWRAGKQAPFKPKLPMAVTIEMRTIEQAETLARKPGVRLIPPLTVETEVERQCDVLKWVTGTGLDMPAERG